VSACAPAPRAQRRPPGWQGYGSAPEWLNLQPYFADAEWRDGKLALSMAVGAPNGADCRLRVRWRGTRFGETHRLSPATTADGYAAWKVEVDAPERDTLVEVGGRLTCNGDVVVELATVDIAGPEAERRFCEPPRPAPRVAAVDLYSGGEMHRAMSITFAPGVLARRAEDGREAVVDACSGKTVVDFSGTGVLIDVPRRKGLDWGERRHALDVLLDRERFQGDAVRSSAALQAASGLFREKELRAVEEALAKTTLVDAAYFPRPVYENAGGVRPSAAR
jgi:hypothetical protein